VNLDVPKEGARGKNMLKKSTSRGDAMPPIADLESMQGDGTKREVGAGDAENLKFESKNFVSKGQNEQDQDVVEEENVEKAQTTKSHKGKAASIPTWAIIVGVALMVILAAALIVRGWTKRASEKAEYVPLMQE